jgi:hypothetical protein
MDAIERLETIEQVRSLKASYFRALDGEDWLGLERVFAPDVRTEFPGREVMTTREELVAALRVHHDRAEVVSVHQGHQAEITVVDSDNVTAVWAMSDLVDRIWREDGRRECFVGFGYYHDAYRRGPSGWQITGMRLTRIRVDWIPVGADAPFPRRGTTAVNVQRRR